MMKKAAPSRLMRKALALILTASLVITAPGVSLIASAAQGLSQGPSSGWRSYVKTFSSPSEIPFLKQSHIVLKPEHLDGFIRFMERTGTDPRQPAEIIRASIGKTANQLIAQADTLSTSPKNEDLAQLRRLRPEFEALSALSVLFQEAALSAKIENKIEKIRLLWDDEKTASPNATWVAGQNSSASRLMPHSRKEKPAAKPLEPVAPPAEVPKELSFADRLFEKIRGVFKKEPPPAPKPREEHSPETEQVLKTLGLTYPQFQRLAQAQIDFERELLDSNPAMKQAIFSLRTQERFSKTVLTLAKDRPLSQALLSALQNYYGDLLPPFSDAASLFRTSDKAAWQKTIRKHFREFIGGAEVEAEDSSGRRVARALATPYPVLFKEAAGSDRELMRELKSQSAAQGAELTVLWSHPFTEERQLIGHKVPKEGRDNLEFGYGELMRQVHNAQANPEKRFILLIKNVEAMEPGVRTQLQEALRIRELTHPELGRVSIPANLQFLFTLHKDANLEDDSFYDRVVVKALPANDSGAAPALNWPRAITEDNYLGEIKLLLVDGRPILALPGARIPLSAEFKGITSENLHDMIYLKTGLVLDYETVRMLSAMAQAGQNGIAILRIEGPTGLGKTFTAQGYARLRGRGFFSNPVNTDTELSAWIGGFEQDDKGLFRFNGETTLKRRLEEGGVVALSELNTLLDSHEKASLAWWLTQIAETAPGADGTRVIRLSEVPTALGRQVPAIKIHRDALIIVDTNPEGDYSVRGGMPEIFKENTPILKVEPLASGTKKREAAEKKRLRLYADMFLKHDWALASGITDEAARGKLSARLADIYWRAAQGQINGEWGKLETKVLSVRELKRMAQDALYALKAGQTANQALGTAAYAHLAAAWESAADRDKILEVLREELGLHASPADFQEFVADQLLLKKRPVHIRVSADTDVRSELRGLLEKSPETELSIISLTDETDRFQMEGGLVADAGGEGLEFGHGMFGRLIEKARASPAKKILYVFDNAHNLRPEQIVAFNEFLQEGKLYPKGSKELSLPANAHILFVSRADSALTWSPAERSRFVEFFWRPEHARLREAASSRLAGAFSALSDSLAAFLRRWTADIYLAQKGDFGQDGAVLSQARFGRFLSSAAQAVEQTLEAGLGLAELSRKLQKAVEDVFLIGMRPEKWNQFKGRSLRELELFAQAHQNDNLLKHGAAPASFAGRLAQAQLDFSQAVDAAQKDKAAAKLEALLNTNAGEILWKNIPREQLKSLDVARVLALRQAVAPGETLLHAAFTPDGTMILAETITEFIALHWNGKNYERVWEKPQSATLSGNTSLEISGNGRTFFIKDYHRPENASFVDVLHWDGQTRDPSNQKRIYKPIWDHKKFDFNLYISDLSADGQALAFCDNEKGLVYVYLWNKGAKSYEEALNVSFGSFFVAHDRRPRTFQSLRLSADGRTLLVGKMNGLYILHWNGTTYENVWHLAEELSGSAMTSDGKEIMTRSSYDGNMKNEIKIYRWDGLLAEDKKTRIYDIILQEKGYPGGVLALKHDGTAFALNAYGGETIYYEWDGQSLKADGTRDFRKQWKGTVRGGGFQFGFADLPGEGKSIIIESPDGQRRLVSSRIGIVSDKGSLSLLQDRQEIDPASLPETVETLQPPKTQTPAPSLAQLAQAQLTFSQATGAKQREAALAAIGRLAKALAPELTWEDRPREKVNPMEMARVLALKEQFESKAFEKMTATPDGLTILAHTRYTLFVLAWNGRTYEKTWEEKITSAPDSVSLGLAPGGRTFVFRNYDGAYVYHWDGKSYQRVWDEYFHGKNLTDVAISDEGRTIVIETKDSEKGLVLRWDGKIPKEKEKRSYQTVHSELGRFYNPAVSADGDTILLSQESPPKTSLLRWNGLGYKEIWSVDTHATKSAMTPDAKTLLLGHGNKTTLYRWDGSLEPEGRRVYSKIGEEKFNGGVWSLALSADGRKFMVATSKGQALSFEASEGNPDVYHETWRKKIGDGTSSLGLAPDGRSLLIGAAEEGLGLYAPETAVTLENNKALVLENGREIVSNPLDTVKVLKGEEKPWLNALQKAKLVFSQATDQKEKEKALAEIAGLVKTHDLKITWEGTPADKLKDFQIAKAPAAAPLQEISGVSGSLTASTPDGRYILAAGDALSATLYERDPVSGLYAPTMSERLKSQITDLSVNPDGKTFLIVSQFDKIVRGFRKNAQGYRNIFDKEFKDSDGRIDSVGLTRDGSAVLVAVTRLARLPGNDKETLESFLRVYAEDGELLGEEILPEPVQDIVSTPDGKFIGLKLHYGTIMALSLDPASNKITTLLPKTPRIPLRYSSALAVTPDGKTVFIGDSATLSGGGGRVLVLHWDESSQKYREEASIDLETGVHSLSVGPDGKTFLAGSGASDGTRGEVAEFRWDGQSRTNGRRDYLRIWAHRTPRAVWFAALTEEKDTFLIGIPPEDIFSAGKIQIIKSRSQAILTKDARTAVFLDSGKELSLAGLGPVEAMRESSPDSDSSAAFKPRHGNKPYYFATDEKGQVLLNFKGRWLPTRHKLMQPLKNAPLKISDLQDPYSQKPKPLSEADFLMETSVLEDVEESVLNAFADGWTVNLAGPPGGGKTSISREVALLLGLPRFVFQMHGERELADLIGGYREDRYGRIELTSKPQRDAQGRPRFKLPLLDMIANGGVFVLDEGAIGERGRELLSWFSAAVRDKEIVLQEFPGQEIRIPVHKDFHLIVTNNDAGETAGRLKPKSEIASSVHTIRVDEDESPETLERLFAHFLGEGSALKPEDKARWGKAVAALHHRLKPLIGKELGKENKDRYYLSKREIRRVATQVRKGRGFTRALSSVYAAMFSRRSERDLVEKEIQAVFPYKDAAPEAGISDLTRELFLQDEPVLYISERGARSSALIKTAADALSAKLEMVDAAPEHTELELLGGLLPQFGPRPAGSPRAKNVRGRLSRHLLTENQLNKLSASSDKPQPIVLWIRNIDQWKEEIRTALNGFLEDGFIDLEVEEGRTERFYKPPHLHLIAEIASDSTQDFSSAFFNRWVKIGVSQDSPEELEAILRSSHDLDPQEAFYVKELYQAVLQMDQASIHSEKGRGWANRKNYEFGPTLFYALGEALRLSRQENRRWRELFDDIARSGYDPRANPSRGPPDASMRRIFDAYHGLVKESFLTEARRLIGARLSPEKAHTDIPDSEGFEEILKIILKSPKLPPRDLELPVPSLVEAAKKNGMRPTSAVLSTLAILSRADSLGKATALIGETGAGKTSLAALWASLTGRDFYKYQAHAGSEQSDLTIDVEQEETGEFKKRVKELYRKLRQGNVVIDIDEANVAPWVLWALEPVLRGEKRVHPIFPEEEPFTLGPGVQVILTFNPVRYSGRGKIDPRLLEMMIVAWQGLPKTEEMSRIVESFYGVWEQRKEAAVKPKETVAEDIVPVINAAGVASRSRGDRLMRKGRETFDPNDKSTRPSPSGPKEQAHGIFSPELYPYTRQASYDQYDASVEEWVRSGKGLMPVPVSKPEEDLRELRQTHDIFDGRTVMKLTSSWQILPSAGPDMRFLDISAYDAEGRKLSAAIELARDSADNYFIRSKASVTAEIRYQVAVPAQYYGRAIPAGLKFAYPSQIPDEVRQAMELIGLKGQEEDLRSVLHKLVEFFRDFSLNENGILETGGSLYLDLIRSRCGVCRHRAFAFARTALGLGLPVRYVESETHAWAEVDVPGLGWLRVDLGGGGDPSNMDLSALANERHSARQGDGFPQPKNYKKNGEEYSKRMKQAMAEQGVRPQHASRPGGGQEGQGGGGSGLSKESARIQEELAALRQQLSADAKIKDELSGLFASGKGDTQFIFSRMQRALADRVRITKQRMKRGLEIDPVAFMLKKPKQFIRRKKEEKLQTTALSVLLDFSGSMTSVKDQLSYTIGAVGENFWKLRETAPQHFFYDLSSFTEQPKTVVSMGERLGEEENARRLVTMANSVGEGGTEILPALRKKLEDFTGSRQARVAKVKYLILFTDGADSGAVREADKRYAVTDEMAALLKKYHEAGIDVVAIGIGQGAQQVAAFNGPGQHFVRIADKRSSDIAEAIAKVAELKSRGSGRLPDGELNAVLQIEGPASR